MASAAVNILSGANGSGVNQVTTAAFTPVADRLYTLAVFANRSGASNTPTITSTTGLTFVLIGAIADLDGNSKTALWRAMKSSGLGSGTVTINFAGQTQDIIQWIIDETTGTDITGVDGAGAIVQSVTNNAGSGASQVTAVTGTLAAFGSASNGTYFTGGWIDPESGMTGQTPNAGFTELVDKIPVAKWENSTNWRADNSITCTSTLDAGSGKGMIVAIEIAVPSAPGAAAPPGHGALLSGFRNQVIQRV